MNERDVRATRGRLVVPFATLGCLTSFGGAALGWLQHEIDLSEAPAWIAARIDRLPDIARFGAGACFAIAFMAFVAATTMYVRSRAET